MPYLSNAQRFLKVCPDPRPLPAPGRVLPGRGGLSGSEQHGAAGHGCLLRAFDHARECGAHGIGQHDHFLLGPQHGPEFPTHWRHVQPFSIVIRMLMEPACFFQGTLLFWLQRRWRTEQIPLFFCALLRFGSNRNQAQTLYVLDLIFHDNIETILYFTVCEDKESCCMLLLRIQIASGEFLWLHTVFILKEGVRSDRVVQLVLITYQALRFSPECFIYTQA